MHFFRGNRTLSTLERMPDSSLISAYEKNFENTCVLYFGAVSWLSPLLAKLIGENRACFFSNWFDRFLKIKKMAFKFVMSTGKKS